MPPRVPKSVDVVVVGGGTAGAVVAGRIAEKGDRSVLVLEAGADYGGLDAGGGGGGGGARAGARGGGGGAGGGGGRGGGGWGGGLPPGPRRGGRGPGHH